MHTGYEEKKYYPRLDLKVKFKKLKKRFWEMKKNIKSMHG